MIEFEPEEETLPEPEAETFPSEPSTPLTGSRLFNPPVKSDKARAPEDDDPIVAVNARVEIYQHSKLYDGRHGVVLERKGDMIKVKMVDSDTISRFRRQNVRKARYPPISPAGIRKNRVYHSSQIVLPP